MCTYLNYLVHNNSIPPSDQLSSLFVVSLFESYGLINKKDLMKVIDHEYAYNEYAENGCNRETGKFM